MDISAAALRREASSGIRRLACPLSPSIRPEMPTLRGMPGSAMGKSRRSESSMPAAPPRTVIRALAASSADNTQDVLAVPPAGRETGRRDSVNSSTPASGVSIAYAVSRGSSVRFTKTADTSMRSPATRKRGGFREMVSGLLLKVRVRSRAKRPSLVCPKMVARQVVRLSGMVKAALTVSAVPVRRLGIQRAVSLKFVLALRSPRSFVAPPMKRSGKEYVSENQGGRKA